MPRNRSAGRTPQVLGGTTIAPTEAPPGSHAKLLFGFALVVFALFGAGRLIATSPSDEQVVRLFAAAIDRGDASGARELIADPTMLMWPTYWSFLNIEHISPFGDRLDEFIDYQRTLGSETEISQCTTRRTASGEPDGYDSWVRCEYALRDALSERLGGPSAATFGQLSAGLKDGHIRTVFAIRSDRTPILVDFRTWITSTYPEQYADLLAQPAVLQLDVPIIGLVVTDYNAATASRLIEFAEAYAEAGFPAGDIP